MREIEGEKWVIAGDFNCIWDTERDKVGGNARNGKEGVVEEGEWRRDKNLIDIWRERNKETCGWTWTRDNKVKTRIDRVLISENLADRTRDVGMYKAKVSDHKIVTWSILHGKKKEVPYERVTAEVIADKEFQETVRKMIENMMKGEVGDILDGTKLSNRK